MRKRLYVPLLVLGIILLMIACATNTSTIESMGKPTDYQVIATTETEDPSRSPYAADSNGKISWHQKLAVGEMIYSINSATVINKNTEIGKGRFRDYACLTIYDGELYEDFLNAPREYRDNYITEYVYPDFIDSTGTFVHDSYMVVLDISVQNQDATNQFYNESTGNLESDYDNLYLFRADSIICLLDITQKNEDGIYETGRTADFFSELGNFIEHPMAYELLPGETISFQIGFLVGNYPNGAEIDASNFVLSTSWNSLDQIWFDLELEGDIK